MFDCILLVAGKSTRFHNSTNKVLYEIHGKPVFYYSLKEFLSLRECRKIIIVSSEDSLSKIKETTKGFDLSRILFTIGGEERQDSVYEGLKLVESDVVLIHDGARPLIRQEDILNVYQETKLHKAAVLAIKATDTVKEVISGNVKTLERSNLWLVQTPQGVHKEDMKEALNQAKQEGYYGTDDVSLLEHFLHVNPKMVVGAKDNIKVTSIEDIKYLEYIMGEKNGI